MKFWLYQLTGDKRYLDKTPYITPLFNEGEVNEYFEGAIIDDTSVIEPTFKFSRHNYWKKCNYLFCQDTLRYYYVSDVTMSQGFVYVKCHVDVLMTFRNALKDREIIVKRTESKNHYNKFLQDDKYKTCASPQVRTVFFTQPPSNGFSKNNRHFVLCLVGKGEVTPETPEE